MIKKIIVECKPDEILAKAIGFSVRQIAHQSNKGEVCNMLQKNGGTLLAIVDEDPSSANPKYMAQFSLKEEKFDVQNLYLKKENKTILVLKPRLEEWILKRCEITGIKPEDYHLSSDNKKLKDTINQHLGRFKELLDALIKKEDEGLIYLKSKAIEIYRK